MTDLIDHADSGEVTRIPGEKRPRLVGEHTEWLNPHLATMAWPVLRRQIDTTAEISMPQTIGVHGPFKPGGVIYGGRPVEAWIVDMLTEPPTGPVPPPPPTPAKADGCECCSHEVTPPGAVGKHRRHLDRLVKGFMIGAGAVTAALLGVDLAALLIMGGLR